jgi:hypothetical protein
VLVSGWQLGAGGGGGAAVVVTAMGCVVTTGLGLGAAGELVTAAGVGVDAGELLAATGAMGPWWLAGLGVGGPAIAPIKPASTIKPPTRAKTVTVARLRPDHGWRGGWTAPP